MIEIYRNHDSATVGALQDLLGTAGIRTYQRNEHASGTTVVVDVYPALCVLDEADVERAVELIRDYTRTPEDQVPPELDCPKCGEKSPGTFDTCWNCGALIGGGVE